MKITEDQAHHVVFMECAIHRKMKIVETHNAQFAYLEINRFRKEHENCGCRKKGVQEF